MSPEHIADVIARVLDALPSPYSCFLPFEEPFNGDAGDAGPARELLGLDLALHGPVQHPVPGLPDEPRCLGEADPLFVHLARCGHSSHLESVNVVLNHRARIDTTYHGIRQEENGIISRFVEMLTAKGFGPRIRQAVLDRAAQLGARYTDKDFGRDVGMAERGKPWGGSTVGEWVAERNEPSIATFKAMSYVTGKSIMWLMGIDELVLKPTSAKPAGVTEMPEMSETRLGQSEAPAQSPPARDGGRTGTPRRSVGVLGTSTTEVVGGIIAVGVLVVAASAVIKRLAVFILGLIDRFR